MNRDTLTRNPNRGRNIRSVISAIFLIITIFPFSAGMAASQENSAFFDTADFNITGTTICGREDRNIYKLEGPLDIFQASISDKFSCGIAYSYKDERNNDIFIFGIINKLNDLSKISLENYAKAVAGRYLKSAVFELSPNDEAKAGPFLRQKFLIKPTNSEQAQWGVIDISFRSVSDGAAVIFAIGPYVAWFPDKLGENNMDTDLQAALTSTRAALDIWFDRNQSLIFEKWGSLEARPHAGIQTKTGDLSGNKDNLPVKAR